MSRCRFDPYMKCIECAECNMNEHFTQQMKRTNFDVWKESLTVDDFVKLMAIFGCMETCVIKESCKKFNYGLKCHERLRQWATAEVAP